MLKTKLIVSVLALFAFTAAPAVVSAEEGAPRTSYSKKKQGKVPFRKSTEKAMDESQNRGAPPQRIEPAAGSMEEQDEKADESMAEKIKLPRKN